MKTIVTLAITAFLIMCPIMVQSTSFEDAIRAAAQSEWKQVPKDWQCIEPGVSQTFVNILNWQRERIAQLEKQLRETQRNPN